jgi:hypothetical protein
MCLMSSAAIVLLLWLVGWSTLRDATLWDDHHCRRTRRLHGDDVPSGVAPDLSAGNHVGWRRSCSMGDSDCLSHSPCAPISTRPRKPVSTQNGFRLPRCPHLRVRGFTIAARVYTLGPALPSLGQLRENQCWVCLYCPRWACLQYAPMALTPAIIRWGLKASSDMLRECTRCSKCGHRGGVTVQCPGWGGTLARLTAWPMRR